MKSVYLVADNIYSPLGTNTEQNFARIVAGESSICQIVDSSLSAEPFYASLFKTSTVPVHPTYTRFENYCIASLNDALSKSEIKLSSPDTLFILSTTKGNIEMIENTPMTEALMKQVSLYSTAQKISSHFHAANQPLVVSNACISGVLAIITATRLIQSGQYKHVVVTGADVLSKFIISGFQSLHAMSHSVCKPFNKNRDGINLGECAATVVLSDETLATDEPKVLVGGNSVSNDANHISGPSRTGEELAQAIGTAMRESKLSADDLSFISAHGTATVYNDEMEAKAFAKAALASVPVHSLKGYLGHTLGATGVVESILTGLSLKRGIVLPSKNYTEHGVSIPIHINKEVKTTDKNHALKTASGFGGCNASIIFSIHKTHKP